MHANTHDAEQQHSESERKQAANLSAALDGFALSELSGREDRHTWAIAAEAKC